MTTERTIEALNLLKKVCRYLLFLYDSDAIKIFHIMVGIWETKNRERKIKKRNSMLEKAQNHMLKMMYTIIVVCPLLSFSERRKYN